MVQALTSQDAVDEAGVDDEDLLWSALSHAAAADAYVAQDPWYSPPPVLSLVARAMELTLKAYAAHKGANADTLRYQLSGDLRRVFDTPWTAVWRLRVACSRKIGRCTRPPRIPGREAQRLSRGNVGAPAVHRRSAQPARSAAARLLRGDLGQGRLSSQACGGTPPGLSINARSIYRLNDAPERRRAARRAMELAD